MNRMWMGACLALTLGCASSMANGGGAKPSAPEPSTSAAEAKAGLTGSRRYQLLFGPDLEVIGALKIAPTVVLTVTSPAGTSLPWIPVQASPITLGATIKYIGANEIQSVQFLLDGNPITTCTAVNSNYEANCTFSAVQSGPRVLKVRVTDTEGAPTESAGVNVELVNSVVFGALTTTGTDPNRYIEGWACSSGYSSSRPVTLGTSSSPQAFGAFTASATNFSASTLPECKSSGTAFGFKVLITPSMYADHSDMPLRLSITPAAPGQPAVVLTAPAINVKPTAGTPSVSEASPANGGQYMPNDTVTLTSSLSNDDGFDRVEYFDSLNGSSLACTQTNLPAGSLQSQCSFVLPAGTHRYYAVATDKRGIVGPASALSIQVTTGSRGSLQFSLASSNVGEAAGVATISVARVNGSAGAVGVQYATTVSGTATASADYSAVTGSLSWATNDTSPKTFTVPIINDSATESNETIVVALSAPTNGASLGTPSSTTLTILDDDALVTLVKPVAGSTVMTDQALLLEASVVNSGNPVERVEFWVDDTVLVGQSAVAPYVAVWNEIPQGDGNYEIKARVIYTTGQPQASTPVTVSVVDTLPQACPVPGAKSRLIRSLAEVLGLPASFVTTPLSIEPSSAEITP